MWLVIPYDWKQHYIIRSVNVVQKIEGFLYDKGIASDRCLPYPMANYISREVDVSDVWLAILKHKW